MPARWLLSVGSLCLLGSLADAGTPRLARLSVPGGQRGATVEVDLIGRNMDRPQELLVYGPGVSVESLTVVDKAVGNNGREQPVEPGTRVRAKLKLAADCPLGPTGFRLRTATGLSEYVRFFVGPFPTVDEDEVVQKERNDKPATAKAVPVNTTVNGRLNDQHDVDLYRVEVKKGQRVSAELEAARVGVDRGIPDLHLSVLDADGKVLAAADDSALFVQDPVVSLVADRDGAYFVAVRDGMYNGSGDPYRLHVGTFARPTAVYPAGGPPGAAFDVQVLGDPKGVWAQPVRLPSAPGDFAFVASADGVPAPTPNRMRVSPFPNVLETEPNDTPDALSPSAAPSLPLAFNGIINRPGDVDCFKFRAKKGERFVFHALANALGTPVDPVIWVRAVTAKGNGGMQRAAESRVAQHGLAPGGGLNRVVNDPVLEFAAPADGEYVLGVEDERGQGGADFVYRVEARPDEGAVHTYVAPEPDNQFQPQLRQSIAVPAGNRTTVQVGVFAASRLFSGEMELVGVGMPAGMTLRAPTLKPGTQRVPVVFEAADGAKPAAALVDLVLRPVGGGDPLPGGYRQTILMNAYGNNDYYLHVPVDRLAVAVTEPAGFAVEVEEPKTALVQNGETGLKFKVRRTGDFTGPVTVQMEWKPAGVSTATPVTVPAGETEGTYTVGAARNSSPGRHQVTLTAMSGSGRLGYRDGGGRTYVASAPFALAIAEPHVEAKIPRSSIERGKTATLVCKLNHLQKFDSATATLARLPRGVELVDAVRTITPADKEVSFTLRATTEALVGNYQGVVLDLSVTENGQSVRQLTGSGMLRVDAERGAPAKGK